MILKTLKIEITIKINFTIFLLNNSFFIDTAIVNLVITLGTANILCAIFLYRDT